MRTGYGVAKGFSFGLLGLTVALRSAGNGAWQPVGIAGLVLAWVSVAVCVLRGVPVVVEARALFASSDT
jgi:CDP-diacylglycerol--glycerol-3-phosphate 3-phosphatidyltransferase